MRTSNFLVSPILFVRYLFVITAAALILFGAGTFLRVETNPEMKMMYSIYGVLMFGDAFAMFVCGLWINRQNAKFYWFAVILLILNIVSTIFDQFGIVDFLFVLLNSITVVILVALRKEFI